MSFENAQSLRSPALSFNPLLGRVKLPGKVFQLPSKGVFYKPGVLADTVKDGEIQVKPMSALTELKIRSADLLFSNKILEEVCQECASEILKPDRLISKDVDALFTFLVASTYGTNKNITVTHYDCTAENPDSHEYIVDLEKIIGQPNNGLLDHKDAVFTVEMPNSQIVKLKPISFGESITLLNLRNELSRREDGSISHKDKEKIVISELLSVIEAVEDKNETEKIRVTDLKMIEEWIRQLPRKYVDLIIKGAADSADWGYNFTVDLKCKDCHQAFKYDLELNPVNFFTE